MSNKKVIVGGIYKRHHYWNEGARFIVTATGLNSVLIADYPMIKFNESYMEYCVSRKEFVQSIDNIEFRPLRTEAERKHEAVLESICAVLEMVAQDYKREGEAKLIYEAIAAGKIPGVKLED